LAYQREITWTGFVGASPLEGQWGKIRKTFVSAKSENGERGLHRDAELKTSLIRNTKKRRAL